MEKKLLFLSLLFVFKLNAQNIAYVYQDSLLQALPHYVENVKKIDSLKQLYLKEIDDAKQNLAKKFTTLLKPYNVRKNEPLSEIKTRMSVIDTTQLTLLVTEDKLIRSHAKNYDQLLTGMFNTDVKPHLDRLNAVIAKYAKKNKIDYVVIMEQIANSFAFVNHKKNITRIIIAKIQ